MDEPVQKIMMFQQKESGGSKIDGIARFGNNVFDLQVVSIDLDFPLIIDDTRPFLPRDIEADLVLDFLKHPDLSHDLALICRGNEIPLIASGKRIPVDGVISPPT